MTHLRRDYEDIGFTVVCRNPRNETVIEFDVYQIAGHSEGETKGVYDKISWPLKGGDYSESTTKLEDAERYLHGSVKWDGCSNWYFDEQDNVMLHFCELSGIKSISKVMEHCWRWAAELCPSWLGSEK